jgi:hypothetical protein
MDWLISVLDAFSAFVGRGVGYTRHANQSISGKAFEDHLKGKKWVRRIINSIFFLQKDHCKLAWLADEKRAEEEIAFKKKLRQTYNV